MLSWHLRKLQSHRMAIVLARWDGSLQWTSLRHCSYRERANILISNEGKRGSEDDWEDEGTVVPRPIRFSSKWFTYLVFKNEKDVFHGATAKHFDWRMRFNWTIVAAYNAYQSWAFYCFRGSPSSLVSLTIPSKRVHPTVTFGTSEDQKRRVWRLAPIRR